jgi:glutamyl/glutaminyl-tRNA synthetase
MILGPDNERLSKRHGATSVGQFKDLGYTPEAMINFLGLLSWSIDGKTTIMSRDEMIKHFDVKNVNKSAAVFDFAKLDWMNGIYLREKISDDDFIKLVFKHCQEHGLVAKDATPDDWFKKFAIGIKPKISSIKDLYKEVDFLFT